MLVGWIWKSIFSVHGTVLNATVDAESEGYFQMQKRPYLNNKTIRVIFILTVNIVIFFILVETTTLALYFFSHGELFYMRSQNYETIPTPEANENPMLAGNRFHPYFGFVVEPGRIFIPAAHQMIKFEKEEGEKIQPQMWEGVKVNNHGS